MLHTARDHVVYRFKDNVVYTGNYQDTMMCTERVINNVVNRQRYSTDSLWMCTDRETEIVVYRQRDRQCCAQIERQI